MKKSNRRGAARKSQQKKSAAGRRIKGFGFETLEDRRLLSTMPFTPGDLVVYRVGTGSGSARQHGDRGFSRRIFANRNARAIDRGFHRGQRFDAYPDSRRHRHIRRRIEPFAQWSISHTYGIRCSARHLDRDGHRSPRGWHRQLFRLDRHHDGADQRRSRKQHSRRRDHGWQQHLDRRPGWELRALLHHRWFDRHKRHGADRAGNPKNARNVEIYDGQLYLTSDKTTQIISQVGVGEPTSGTPTLTGLPGARSPPAATAPPAACFLPSSARAPTTR